MMSLQTFLHSLAPATPAVAQAIIDQQTLSLSPPHSSVGTEMDLGLNDQQQLDSEAEHESQPDPHSKTPSVSGSILPEELRLQDVLVLCRDTLGEDNVPRAPVSSTARPDSLGLQFFGRTSVKEDHSLPQSKVFAAEAALLHHHIADYGSQQELFKPPLQSEKFFFSASNPRLDKFSLHGAYATHTNVVPLTPPLVESEFGKPPFSAYQIAQEAIIRALIPVASSLEIFASATIKKLMSVIPDDSLPPETHRMAESLFLSLDHMSRLITRMMANAVLVKRDLVLKSNNTLTTEHKLAARVAPLTGEYLCNRMPEFARKRQVELHIMPTIPKKKPASSTETQAKSGGKPQTKSQPKSDSGKATSKKPFRKGKGGGKGNRGKGKPSGGNDPKPKPNPNPKT